MGFEDFSRNSAVEDEQETLQFIMFDELPPASQPASDRSTPASTTNAAGRDTALSGAQLQTLARDLGSDNVASRNSAQETIRGLDPAQVVMQLGSEQFRSRDAASRILESMGPRAINALEAGVRSDDLETSRRSQHILQRLDGPNFDRLVAGLRDPDQAVRQAAELRISRMSTDSLLDRVGRGDISGRELDAVSRMIRNRNSDEQIRQLYIDGRAYGADESTLRRQIGAQRILGEDTRDSESRLGDLISQTPGREAEAEVLLRRSLQGQNVPAQAEIRSNIALADVYSRMPGRADDARRHMNSALDNIQNSGLQDPKNNREHLDRILQNNNIRMTEQERQRATGLRTALQNQIDDWKKNFGAKKAGQ
ncbi:MAG: hypothetical protein K2X27_16695 [Candidatus Obscuribacterales bacterium]|nr:hypothetical protein [Candidatus Obscuribacterales bacterium]